VPKIAAAKDAANANDFSVARSTFDEARRNYARLLAEDLEEKLTSEPVPPGIPSADWDQVVARVKESTAAARQATDPDRAIEAYQSGYAIYLRKLIEDLRERARNGATIIDAIGTIPDADKTQLKQDIKVIVNTLDGAIRKLQVMQLQGAADDYGEAK